MSRVVRFACGKPTTNHRVNAAVIHYLLAAPCPTQHPSYHKRPRPSSFDAWFEDTHLFTASASALPMMRSVVSEILPAGPYCAREPCVNRTRGGQASAFVLELSRSVSIIGSSHEGNHKGLRGWKEGIGLRGWKSGTVRFSTRKTEGLTRQCSDLFRFLMYSSGSIWFPAWSHNLA